MMQNLTLPTSQTLALGAMDVKNNTGLGKSNLVSSNTSFEMMLSKQVKAHKDAIHQKPAQYKPVQHKAEQDKQKNDNLADANASIAQMVANAKGLLANDDSSENRMLGAQIEEDVGNSSLVNAESPTFSPEALALALALTPVANSTAAIGAKDNQSLKVDGSAASDREITLTKALSEFNSTPSNSPITTQADAVASQLNLDADDTGSQQDRQLWASVSTAKPSQNSELVNGNALLNASTKTVDAPKFSDIVNNLAMPTSQQNQALQPSSVSALHQLGSGNQINAYPGKTGWDQAISQKIVWMVGATEQSATLTLNPPDLGPLQVVINVRNDMANTTFISGNAEVRQALQDGMANLREKMAESGVQLGQANVSSEGRHQQEFQQAILNQKSSDFSGGDSILPTETVIQKGNLSRINNGLVDTFA